MISSKQTRIIAGAVGIALFLPIMIFSDKFVFPIAIALLSCFGMFELVRCAKLLNVRFFLVITMLYGLITPILARFCYGINAIACATMAYILLSVLYLVASQETEMLSKYYSTVMLAVYVVFGFSCLVLIRDLQAGNVMIWYVFATAWLTDSFAYFCGTAFGKTKLIPKLSPNKTVEGSVGGTAVTLIAMLVVTFIVDFSAKVSPNYVVVMLLVFFSSVFAQVGDLALSQVKRYYQIKDYSRIMPGHGGVLDRFDSVFAVAISMYILSSVFYKVVLF